MLQRFRSHLFAHALFGLAFAVAGFARADDKKPDDKKPAIDPKEVRVGPPPELADLRKAVEDAARKGENVDEIRKQLEALEKALAGKAWVKPKPVEEQPPPIGQPFPNPRVFPNPVPFPNPPMLPPLPGFDPQMLDAMQKAQELMLKAALIRGEDPAKADELMKQARELMGARGGLLLPPAINMRPAVRGTGRLGIRVEKLPAAIADQVDLPAGRGVLAAEIVPGSAAEKAGIKANDIILEFAGKPVGDDPTEFVRTVHGMKSGEKVDIVYLRKGKKAEAKAVPLADAPDPRRGGFEGLPRPGFELVPLPVPVPIDPVLPLPPGGVQKSTSVSVKVQNGAFTIDAQMDGVKFTMEGPVGDTNKAVPTKIEIVDGAKKLEAASVEKVPAEYRDRVQKILDGVKVGK